MAAALWFTLVTLPLAAVASNKALDARWPSTRTLVWVDLTGGPVLPASWAQHEATRMLAQAGLAGRWRTGGANQVLAPGELAVILLERRGGARGGTLVLGACRPAGDAPAVWVYLEDVRKTLGLPERGALPARETLQLARALGRVTAHELIHMAAPGLSHASSGLMSARLDRRELLSRDLAVDVETRRSLTGNSWVPQGAPMAWNTAASVSSKGASIEAH
jgi:hypothetical protein